MKGSAYLKAIKQLFKSHGAFLHKSYLMMDSKSFLHDKSSNDEWKEFLA